jgi:hypothetical protein
MAGGNLAEVLAAAGIESVASASAEAASNGTSQPIADLSAAIDSASQLVRSVLPTDVDMNRMRNESMRAARERLAPRDILGAEGHAAFDRAAAGVAGAIDRALPQLLAQPMPAPSGTEVAGCDIVDQPPVVCVAGTGDNVITEDYALVVDRGGADLHANSAGGADPLGNLLPVAVTIDLDGNDRYESTVPTASGSIVAQGAGFLGVGFLVDVAGNDVYRIENESAMSIAYGQGKGEHGFGLLADYAGNDIYEISTTGGGNQLARGQGEAANGVGILMDRQGDDRYAISALGTEFWVDPLTTAAYPPAAVVQGLGRSVMGAYGIHYDNPPVYIIAAATIRVSYGILADGGGADKLDLNAAIADPKRDELYARLAALPQAEADGIGSGAEGATGLAVLGEGDTAASIRASGRLPLGITGARGFGYGYGGGTGILSDRGGDDVRQLTGDTAIERRATHVQDCICPPPGISASGFTNVLGMGYGGFMSPGLLEDAAGDDRYLVSATNLVETELRDERADENGKTIGSLARSGPVTAVVQGSGEDQGAGELLDEKGNDRYEVVASSEARTRATGHGSAPAPTATAIAENVTVVAQGSARTLGEGTFTDEGGSDVYTGSSSAVAEAHPSTDVQLGTATIGVLGGVDLGSRATFVDRDDGQVDQFSASPAVAACTGTRGQGQWVDCGGAGVGVMA